MSFSLAFSFSSILDNPIQHGEFLPRSFNAHVPSLLLFFFLLLGRSDQFVGCAFESIVEKMIGKRSLAAFDRMLKFTYFLRLNTIIGMDGSGGERILIPMTPKTYFLGKWEVSRLGFNCMMILVGGNFIFGAVRILQSVLILNDSFQDIMFQLFIQSISLLSCVINSLMFLAMDDLAWVLSLFLNYEKLLTGK